MAKLDHAKRVLKYELFGLAFLALGTIALGDLGAVGQALDELCVTLAGNWHFLLPIYVMWVAGMTMFRRNRFRFTTGQVGIILIILVILTWSEMDLYTQGVVQYNKNYPGLLYFTRQGISSLSQSLQVVFVNSKGTMPPADAGGGMVGYALFAGLRYLFSLVGTMLVLLVIAMTAFVLITRKSLVGMLQKGSQFFEKRLEQGWSRFTKAAAASVQIPHSARKGYTRKSVVKKKDISSQLPKSVPDDELVTEQTEVVAADPFPYPDFSVASSIEAPSFEQMDEPDGESVLIDEDVTMGSLAAPDLLIDTEQSRVTVVLHPREPTRLKLDPLLPTGETTSQKPYRLPDARMLDRSPATRSDLATIQRDMQSQGKKLADTFESFGVQVKVIGYSRGPTVTRYEIQPAVGVKVSRIVNLYDDLALALAARDIRIEAPIPGKSAIGIEVPNQEVSIVAFREVVETDAFVKPSSLLTFALGKDIAGHTVVGDLSKMPHLLVAGATGSGKSVCINGIIASILFRAKPDEVKFILIDPKMVELGVYGGIPHLFAPVVTDARRAAAALRKVIAEMEHRYERFANAKVRDIERYNQHAVKAGKEKLPLIIVIIDELADLMMVAPGDVEDAICRLAQMARAAGIHLVVATQRPSVDVITGLIKANIPSRIAFSVSSGVDSRTILDSSGAEKLLGRGDMLYLPVGASKPQRLQGAFLSEAEVERLVDFVKRQQEAEYIDDFTTLMEDQSTPRDDLDVLFEQAVRLVVESEQASVSFLQRKLKIGYARASRIVDSLEELGIVGPYDNSRPREVRMTLAQWLERQGSTLE